jgi:hypothetical protein
MTRHDDLVTEHQLRALAEANKRLRRQVAQLTVVEAAARLVGRRLDTHGVVYYADEAAATLRAAFEHVLEAPQ